MSPSSNRRYTEWAARHMARANRFVATMFIGPPLLYDRREATSLDEAKQLRDQMLAEYGDSNFKRKVLIYAVTPEDLSVLVE